MGRPSRYSPEVRERAVRMALEHHDECASQWAAMKSVGHIPSVEFEPSYDRQQQSGLLEAELN